MSFMVRCLGFVQYRWGRIFGVEIIAGSFGNRRLHIKLVAHNPHHEPMDVPFAAIQAMAIVKFSIRKEHDDVEY